MYLEKIELKNFKNYESEIINFSDKINFITGENGSGKTNLLDAIYYLSFTKSAFNKVDENNIKNNGDFFLIRGNYKIDNKSISIDCKYKKNEKKTILYNQSPYEKISLHLGKIPAIIVAPNDSDLIRNSSYYRRRFFDLIISQIEQDYLQAIINYNKIIKSRNLVLEKFKKKKYVDKNEIQHYDDLLIQLNIYIRNKRSKYLIDFKKKFFEIYDSITKEKHEIEITYKSKVEESIDENIFNKFLDYDILTEKTNFGIHKDDYLFYINNKPIKNFASQGQQKSFIISLKMSEYYIISEKLSISPLMMLDDIFDKLDNKRISDLMKFIKNKIKGQIFITDALNDRIKIFNSKDDNINVISIKNGQINFNEKK